MKQANGASPVLPGADPVRFTIDRLGSERDPNPVPPVAKWLFVIAAITIVVLFSIPSTPDTPEKRIRAELANERGRDLPRKVGPCIALRTNNDGHTVFDCPPGTSPADPAG